MSNEQSNEKKELEVYTSNSGITGEDLKSIVESRKVVSRVPNTIDFNYVLMMIDLFSSLGEDEYLINGYHVDEWNIPQWMADLVQPAKVTLSNNRGEVDLLEHAESKWNDGSGNIRVPGSLNYWRDMIAAINGVLSKKDVPVVTVGSLKTNVLLSSISNPAFKGMCQYRDQFPIELKYQFTKDNFMAMTTQDVVQDLLRDRIDELRSK